MSCGCGGVDKHVTCHDICELPTGIFSMLNFSFFFSLFVCIHLCGPSALDPNKIISGDIETILSILWLFIWHYSIAATIFESHQISNSIDAYESKKYRLHLRSFSCCCCCCCTKKSSKLIIPNDFSIFPICKDFCNGFK